MRLHPIVPAALALIASSCGGRSSLPGPSAPSSARAVINVRVPPSVPAQLCTRCGDLVGEMQVAVDLVVEEAGGVGGEITGVGVHLLGGTTTIEGPGVFDPEVLRRFGAPTLRVGARGSLTIPELGVHFAPSFLDLLPGTLRLTVHFRDDNRNETSTTTSIVVTR